MFSVTSLVLRSRRSLISAADTFSRIGTYVCNSTNRLYSNPYSYVMRCTLSTTFDSDTYGSGSDIDLKKIKMTFKVGDNPINMLPEISSVIQAPLSADSSKSIMSASAISSDFPPRRYKPMDRDERMAYLEDTIKSTYAALMSLSEEIASATKEQALLLKKEVLSSNESRLLRVIEDVNLPDMRKREDRLVAQIAKHETELNQLKYPKELADAPVPAQGI